MEKKLRVIAVKDGSLVVLTGEGQAVLLRTDGVTGYGFVRMYLQDTERHYRSHLMAVDLLLQRMLGDRYVNVRKVPAVYQSYLAVVSLCCRYAEGCTFASVCPFNGYHPSNRGKRLAGCNPVYELPLTPTQARVAELLVNTAYSLSEMAEVLCISESRVRSLASTVYSAVGVEGRQELVMMLRGKRMS